MKGNDFPSGNFKSESAERPQASTVVPLGKHHLPPPEVAPGY